VFKKISRTVTVLQTMQWSKTGLYEQITDGLFPPPIKLSKRTNAWLDDEIEAIQTARIAGKSPTVIKALVVKLVASRSKAAAAPAPVDGFPGPAPGIRTVPSLASLLEATKAKEAK